MLLGCGGESWISKSLKLEIGSVACCMFPVAGWDALSSCNGLAERSCFSQTHLGSLCRKELREQLPKTIRRKKMRPKPQALASQMASLEKSSLRYI